MPYSSFLFIYFFLIKRKIFAKRINAERIIGNKINRLTNKAVSCKSISKK